MIRLVGTLRSRITSEDMNNKLDRGYRSMHYLMNPVVGLDVAKGESQVQMFLDKKMPYKSSVKVNHTVDGLEALHSYLLDLERQTGMKPPVVLESTGHYHAPVVQFLEAREYIVIIVNPLVSY